MNTAAAFVPIIILTAAFVGSCLCQLSRTEGRYLPKWAWVIVAFVSIPPVGRAISWALA